MEPVTSFRELIKQPVYSKQHWYYVLLVDASDPTPAGIALLRNLDKFDISTGRSCMYYLAGFINSGGKPENEEYARLSANYLGNRYEVSNPEVYIERLGWVPFSYKNFVRFCDELKEKSTTGWRYSGRCELLIFNINPVLGRICDNDFFSYDLDDIVTNGHSVSEFIQRMIIASESGQDKEATKYLIDSMYYQMIIPTEFSGNEAYSGQCVQLFEASRFGKEEYCFISYSTKDFLFVKSIRDNLLKNGILCWMAPYDIPLGASYAYIIEHAIMHANCFCLMLSRNAMHSIWIEKELGRANHFFQRKNFEKLCIVWLDRPFPLDGSQFALHLENVQIKLELHHDIHNVYQLAACISEECGSKMLAASIHEQMTQKVLPILKGFDKLIEQMIKLQSRFINRSYVGEFWKQHALIRGQDFIEDIQKAHNRIFRIKNSFSEMIAQFYEGPNLKSQTDDLLYQRCKVFLGRSDFDDRLYQSAVDIKTCFQTYQSGETGLSESINQFEKASNSAILAAEEARDLTKEILRLV